MRETVCSEGSLECGQAGIRRGLDERFTQLDDRVGSSGRVVVHGWHNVDHTHGRVPFLCLA